MRLPPFALAAALAFWGWRSGNYGAAAALALLAEGPRFVRPRFALDHADFARVADLCTVLFAALLGWLLLSLEPPRTARAVLTTLLWTPAVFAPVLLVQQISSAGRLPLSALFLYLRRLRRRDPQFVDPEIDLAPLYFAACVLAAGIPNVQDHAFYAVLVALVAWVIVANRPRPAAVAALAAAALLGYGLHAALSRSQTALEDLVSDWFLRGMDADPYRSRTEMGSVGRLKLLDNIVLRVPGRAEAPPPRLLHRASFNVFNGTAWYARNAPMATAIPETGGNAWLLGEAAPQAKLRLVIRLENGKALLALPPGTVRVSDMPAAAVRRNALGALQVDFGGDWAAYTAEIAQEFPGYAPPGRDDLEIPDAERAVIARIAAELDLRDASPAQAVERIGTWLGGLRYATYRGEGSVAASTPLADFLLHTKSGHCEYFAAAATLLLRAAGIPARYATGFAVLEHSALEEAYIVRARHAHAWARAYVGGRWIDVDATPPSWAEEEARGAPPWQTIADLGRWAQFRWSQRGALEAGAGWALVLALLIGVFVWRLLHGKRAAAKTSAAAAQRTRQHGSDSELYALEAKLGAREPHESLRAWAARVSPSLGDEQKRLLGEAMALHYRYRFDPRGIDERERRALRMHCAALSARLESTHG